MIGLVLCLRAARSILGWSQTQLAAEATISKPALNRIERFESEPRLETVLKIEEAIARAGIRVEHQEDGEFQITIGQPVITGISDRIKAGESVTSRGKMDGMRVVTTRTGRLSQTDKPNKKR